jgi:hypothetical protein
MRFCGLRVFATGLADASLDQLREALGVASSSPSRNALRSRTPRWCLMRPASWRAMSEDPCRCPFRVDARAATLPRGPTSRLCFGRDGAATVCAMNRRRHAAGRHGYEQSAPYCCFPREELRGPPLSGCSWHANAQATGFDQGCLVTSGPADVVPTHPITPSSCVALLPVVRCERVPVTRRDARIVRGGSAARPARTLSHRRSTGRSYGTPRRHGTTGDAHGWVWRLGFPLRLPTLVRGRFARCAA